MSLGILRELHNMSNAQNKTRKYIKGKDKHNTKQVVAPMQGDYKIKIRKLLLHLLDGRINWAELAYWSSMGKGESGGILKIRFTGAKTSMLQLQHKPRGSRSRFLGKNGSGKRTRIHGQTKVRKKHNS